MKRDVSVEAKKAQFMVEKAMDDITRGTRKVLMDYVSRMYVTSFAKAIAYLGLESEDANSLLNTMDADTRRQEKPLQKRQFITSRTTLRSSRKRLKTAFFLLKISSTSMTELFRRSYETPTCRNWQKP